MRAASSDSRPLRGTQMPHKAQLAGCPIKCVTFWRQFMCSTHVCASSTLQQINGQSPSIATCCVHSLPAAPATKHSTHHTQNRRHLCATALAHTPKRAHGTGSQDNMPPVPGSHNHTHVPCLAHLDPAVSQPAACIAGSAVMHT